MKTTHTVRYIDLEGVTHAKPINAADGEEKLEGWAEACHVIFPDVTICYQNEGGWGVNVPDDTNKAGDGAWVDCIIVPRMDVPASFQHYYDVDANGEPK